MLQWEIDMQKHIWCVYSTEISIDDEVCGGLETADEDGDEVTKRFHHG